MRPGRPLTTSERERLASFAGAVDLDRVRIYDRGTPFGRIIVFLSRGAAVALGYRIMVPDISSLPTLAHEIAHVDQFIRWGPIRYFMAGFWNQVVRRLLLGEDVYGWELETERAYRSYGMEQQGQIVQDCFDPASPRHAQAIRISPFAPDRPLRKAGPAGAADRPA